jgi:hypothetical protein
MAKNRDKEQQKPAETAKNEEKPAKGGLFDLSKLPRPAPAPEAPAAVEKVDILAGMKLNEMLELRSEIDKRLPARNLADLDLEEELLLQFARVKELFQDVMKSKDTPANQQAQVANSCTTLLDKLVEMQLKLYSAERTKAIESAVIRTLKSMPEAVQKRFFEIYERALEAIGIQAPAPQLPVTIDNATGAVVS